MKVVEFWVHTSFGSYCIGGCDESELFHVGSRTYQATPFKRRCEFCNGMYQPKTARSRFCSDLCRSRAYVRHIYLAQGKG